MTLEYLEQQKEKYQSKSDYFSAIEFNNLANVFKNVVDLIEEMEEYIKQEQSQEKDSDAGEEHDENI